MNKCQYCEKTYECRNACNSHIGRCLKNPNRTILKKKKCDKCNSDINVNNFERHYNVCNNKQKLKRKGRGSNIWNKGLTKETNEKILESSEKISNALKGKPGHKHTNETKGLLRKIAIKNELGGHTSKQRINYNGVKLHSSFELKVAQELDKNNIKWVRPTSVKWIDENGIEHRYYADFYLLDFDTYLDPKNDYLINKDKEKIKRVCEQNQVKVIVLDKNNLTWEKINAWVH